MASNEISIVNCRRLQRCNSEINAAIIENNDLMFSQGVDFHLLDINFQLECIKHENSLKLLQRADYIELTTYKPLNS